MELEKTVDDMRLRSQVIVKYNGDLSFLESDGVSVVTLYGGYAVLEAPVAILQEIASLPQIEYLEIPKRLYFSVNQGKAASCITSLQGNRQSSLTGKGIFVGVIDSGLDLSHPDFRNSDGTTRVRWMWDQTASDGVPPMGYNMGVEYGREEIEQLLSEGVRPLPGEDDERHGTPVAGIAAGNGRGSEGRFAGVATESELIIVKLGSPAPDSFPRTSELMQAMNYVVLKAAQERVPVAINVSIGNSDGSHDGSAITERFFDAVSSVGRTVIVVGSGNEGDSSGHASGVLENPVRGSEVRTVEIELAVGTFQTALSFSLWKNYGDRFEVSLISVSGQVIGPFSERTPVGQYEIEGAILRVLYGQPTPYRAAQEIYLEMVPTSDYLISGVYGIRLRPKKIIDGRYHLWLPSQRGRSMTTRFLQPDPEVTLTIPSTAENVITVSAYDSREETYASFSGRGFTRTDMIKPDLAAPGVEIVSAEPGGGYAMVTGTSFAAPFVAGSAALLMEWGIVRGNDPFLYGEKLKAYLIRGARQLPVAEDYPDPRLGWGTLCVGDSLK